MRATETRTLAPDFSRKSLSTYELPPVQKTDKIVVIGAGAFGGWIAFFLRQKKYHVTLVDAWGAGNARSSSGDETRVIRSTYGSNEIYFDLNVEALSLWKHYQNKFRRHLFIHTGALWLCHNENVPVLDDSIPYSKKHNQEYEYLTLNELEKRYPQLNSSDLHHAYLDPYAGYLKARESTQVVLQAFIEAGGSYIQSYALPVFSEANILEKVSLSNGSSVQGTVFIFACGAWLGKIFPFLSTIISSTKQEVYYFGTPHEHAASFDKLPVWLDADSKEFYYGIPGNSSRGFKIGVDKRGDAFDPTHSPRIIDDKVLLRATQYLHQRFPLLKDAPLLENRVCCYENSPDGNFIVDVHPDLSNVIIVGGGSGHGFKHGPALGKLITEALERKNTLPSLFSLKRFNEHY